VNNPRVLIGIPYHKSKRYCMDHILDWLEYQHYQPADVYMSLDMGAYSGKDAIKNQMERMRLAAIHGGYDYLYIMEADTIPPQDALAKLVSRQTDVIGALYYYREPKGEAVAWLQGDQSKSFLQSPANIVEVDGMGTGAVLFSRKALSVFSFLDAQIQDADYPVYDKLKKLGFDIWLDKSIVCKHYADKETWY
jgi:hypothetical protein